VSLQSALINLVRKSYLSASVENDYTTGSPLLTRHDEIAFVDPHGDPCAIPSEPGIDSIDYEYAYATGARGHSLRGSLVKIALNIDYIDNTLKRRLDQWRQERALVWVQPNIGRNPLFSWRAVDMKAGYFSGGPVAKDLTGNYALTSVFGSYLRYWDTARRMFLPKSSSNRTPLVHTPGGAGLVAYPTVVNRMVPTYPKSATMSNAATASGWAIGGADAGDVSAALVTNGFGQADCPHSLRVSVSADTASAESTSSKLHTLACVSIGKTVVKGPWPLRTTDSVTMASSRCAKSDILGSVLTSNQNRSRSGLLCWPSILPSVTQR